MIQRLLAPPASRHCLDLEALAAWPSDADILGRELAAARTHADDQLAAAFSRGEAISELVRARAWVVEQLVLAAWHRLRPEGPGLELAAVGGFGRGELHPHSDVDLLVLRPDGESDPAETEALESFIRVLWDAGLHPGSGVRSVTECEAEAAAYEALALTGSFDAINNKLARQQFEACLDAGARPRQMRLRLIDLAIEDEDWARARGHVDALLETDAEDAAAMTAAIRLERARAEDLDAEAAGALRDRAIRAIMAEPTHVPALLEFVDLTFEHDLAVDDNVVSVIDSIRFLAPDLNAGKIFEARLFASRGAHDEALALVDEMIKWSNSVDEEVELKELRKELAEGSS